VYLCFWVWGLEFIPVLHYQMSTSSTETLLDSKLIRSRGA
jgi:hypothetical protein